MASPQETRNVRSSTTPPAQSSRYFRQGSTGRGTISFRSGSTRRSATAAAMSAVAAAAALSSSSSLSLNGVTALSSSQSPSRGKRSIMKVNPFTPEKDNRYQEQSAANKKIKPTTGGGTITTSRTPRTSSFGAITPLSWPYLSDAERDTPMHTLILGTHPSIKSLSESQYYAHPCNAFWWIVGDCLGFRRASGLSPSTGKPYKFTADLRKEYENNILSYEDQVTYFVRHGFGLWDIVQSCERQGSLDSDIKNPQLNDIRTLANSHPDLRRIVISNGAHGVSIFRKGNGDWFSSGELRANNDEKSQKALGKRSFGSTEDSSSNIAIVVAISPSPAAASFSYLEKRKYWEEHVFAPGLLDYETFQKASTSSRLVV